jgi:hypothetical protein
MTDDVRAREFEKFKVDLTSRADRELELYKSRLQRMGSIISSLVSLGPAFLLLVAGFIVNKNIESTKNSLIEGDKRKEYLDDLYKKIRPDVRQLYNYVCQQGNFYLSSPSQMGALKREVDALFDDNIGMVPVATRDAWRAFKKQIVQEGMGDGMHFKFKLFPEQYEKAYTGHLGERQKNSTSADPEPPTVRDDEFEEWFFTADDWKRLSGFTPPRPDEFRVSYATVAAAIANDLGFKETHPTDVSNQLTCF